MRMRVGIPGWMWKEFIGLVLVGGCYGMDGISAIWNASNGDWQREMRWQFSHLGGSKRKRYLHTGLRKAC